MYRGRMQAAVLVGSGASADVRMDAPNSETLINAEARYWICSWHELAASPPFLYHFAVAAELARLDFKSGRLFCTALAAADPDSLLSPTFTWLEGSGLRAGVAYLVAPAATLAFGEQGASLVVTEFTESGNNAMADMLMKGMASQASKEVQDRLGGR